MGAAREQPAQLVGHVVRGVPAVVGMLGEALRRPRGRARAASAAAAVASAGGSAFMMLPMRLTWLVALERPPARHHLVEDRAERPQVRPRVGLLPLQLLRRHVLQRAEDRPARRDRSASRRPRASRTRAPAARRAPASFARPKSRSFATVTPERSAPPVVSITLPGFRSRWMMPCLCAASSASAICAAMSSACASGSGPFRSRSASVSPARCSMTRKVVPSCSPTS